MKLKLTIEPACDWFLSRSSPLRLALEVAAMQPDIDGALAVISADIEGKDGLICGRGGRHVWLSFRLAGKRMAQRIALIVESE